MRRTVAVVGGGCSGVLVVRELLRRNGSDRVVLVEPGEPGGGVAYGHAHPWHLLNSRAGAMSADPEDPADFVRFSGADAADFRPRAEYGRYLRGVFERALAGDPGRLEVRREAALRVVPRDGGGDVVLDGGATVRADAVVLATGGPAASRPRLEHPRYIDDPWAPGVLEGLPGDRPVLLVGTGLTAVDAALTLNAGNRRSAPVVAVSRRGLLPMAHTEDAAPPVAPELRGRARLRDVVRAVRAAAGEAGDWRPVVDGLRPHLDRLWSEFTAEEQDVFLRHLARAWECHRHRMAPGIAARVAELRAAGLLEVRKGGVAAWPGLAGYAAVVNCAGPGRLPVSASPLVRRLLDDGAARVGPHGLGLEVAHDGRVTDREGRARAGLWLVGPLRRGSEWETTAVPEIRSQARRIAAAVAA